MDKSGLSVLGNVSIGEAIERVTSFADKITVLLEHGAKNILTQMDKLTEIGTYTLPYWVRQTSRSTSMPKCYCKRPYQENN
jgi:predicted ATP-dependent Lon-type protease